MVIGGLVLPPIINKTFNDINNSLQNTNPSGTTAPSDTSAPSSGPAAGGLGDSLLKTDVWKSIMGYYAGSKNCSDVTNTQIEVSQKPDSTGAWQEAWTVVACGQSATLTVKFTPSAQGGTDFSFTP